MYSVDCTLGPGPSVPPVATYSPGMSEDLIKRHLCDLQPACRHGRRDDWSHGHRHRHGHRHGRRQERSEASPTPTAKELVRATSCFAVSPSNNSTFQCRPFVSGLHEEQHKMDRSQYSRQSRRRSPITLICYAYPVLQELTLSHYSSTIEFFATADCMPQLRKLKMVRPVFSPHPYGAFRNLSPVDLVASGPLAMWLISSDCPDLHRVVLRDHFMQAEAR